MKLKYKLFIILLSTSCLILMLVMGVMQFIIQKNFIKFLNDVEFGKQTKMVSLLLESYTRHSGWEEFQGSPMAWHRLLARSRPEKALTGMGPPSHFKGKRPPGPHPGPSDPERLHLCLFDKDKNYLAGECRQESQFDFHPIVLSGRTIGWLGLENRKDIRTTLEMDFLREQTRAFYIILGGILGLSLLVSFVIARHVLRPVRALARGTREMCSFNFDTRVNVNSNDELGALAADFNLMAGTLRQYESMRKNWISDISHELRTPVAVIRSKIEALQDGIRELTPELLASLHKDILGLGQLINDLHQISILDSANLRINMKPVSLTSVINRSMDAFLIRFEQAGIEIQTDWEPDALPAIKGDAALLKRVFANLLENTLKYTDSPGKLRLGCRVMQNRLLIELEDSAPGVPETCLESIFDRLYRVEQSRNRRLGGSGLGLSMTREIISQHKGTIKAFNSSLGGLKIEIRLPVNPTTP